MKWSGAGLLAALLAVFVADGWCAIDLHRRAHERAHVQDDYGEVNGIEHGLLSVEVWMGHLRRMVTHQIRHFSLNEKQRRLVKAELERALDALIDRVEHLHQGSLKGKIAKAAVGMMSLQRHVPELADGVLDQLKQPESRRELEQLAVEKLDEFAAESRDNDTDRAALAAIYARHGVEDRAGFNRVAVPRVEELERHVRRNAAVLVASLVLVLGAWLLVLRRPSLRHLQKPVFAVSIVIALVTLLAALSSPMIEIDARIHRIDFVLLGEHVQFDNQVLFYQSKSILQVVWALFTAKQADSIFVGVLILLFSVTLPITKLVCSELMLWSQRLRANRVVRVLALKTGKWSMADVLVVAIFMAYVGFKAILDSQLRDLNVHTSSLTSITTNNTSLQPAFILFTSFVLFGLLLAELMRRAGSRLDDERS